MQRADDGGTLVFSTGAQQLQDEEVTKAIDGHARQTVGFTGDQTIAVKAIASRQPFAPGLRLLQATLEKGVIDSFIAIEAPDASADLRRGRIRAAGQPFPLRINDIDGLTGASFTFHPGDGAGENPRMATQQGFLASFG